MMDLFAVLAPIIVRPAVTRTVYVTSAKRHGNPAFVVSSDPDGQDERYCAGGPTDQDAKEQLYHMLRQWDRESTIVWVDMVPKAEMGGVG